MPQKAKYKDRFRCWVCDFRGDEFDLLRHLYPCENYIERHARLCKMRNEYESGADVEPLAKPIHLRGSGSQVLQEDDAIEIELAWADLSDEDQQVLLAAHAVMQGKRVSFEALAGKCFAFAQWIKSSDAQHLDECNDPECDARVCRAARGLPPRTKAEIDAGKRGRVQTQTKK
jgi:hypothetical protein